MEIGFWFVFVLDRSIVRVCVCVYFSPSPLCTLCSAYLCNNKMILILASLRQDFVGGKGLCYTKLGKVDA